MDCSVQQCVAMQDLVRGSHELIMVNDCCSVLQCSAVCCSVLQCVAIQDLVRGRHELTSPNQDERVALCCSV